MSKSPQTPQLPRELSRKYLSRAEREARKTRILLLAVGGALALAILLIGFGIFRDNVLLPNEPVAIVGDQQIMTRAFWQRVRLEREQLINQYDFYVNLGLSDNANQIASALIPENAASIGSQVIEQMVDEEVYRQAAPELGVTVTADELDRSIEEAFGYFSVTPTPQPADTPAPTFTPSPTITASASLTPTTPTPTLTPQPTPTPVTFEGYQTLYRERLNDFSALGFSEADFRHWWETQLIVQEVQDIIQSDVPTRTEQAQFRYIGAETPPAIDVVQQAVAKDGFETVYGQVLSQTFTITNVTAIEYPYLAKFDLDTLPQFGQEFTDAVFTTPISSTFGVITNTANALYYIGQVVNREVRDLDPDALQRLKSKTLQDWLSERRTRLNVQVLRWEDRVPADPTLGQ
ncbi:MAG TPA: SurA N-terminal domain-containing protein [Anaerolineae bacterium]